MRIRSIKPEFWRSDDITSLPLPTRLTFIGLWSYVDDNGVGADKLVSIVADLYADDFASDPLETVKRVTEDLQRLTSGGQVIRFRATHNGSPKDLLYIAKWKQHQRVNHPSLGHKYPLPPAETVNQSPTLKRVSRESQESLTHEQGNRGTGEQGKGSRGTGDEEGPPLPPEPPPGPYDPPACVETINRPAKRHPSSSAKLVVRQELGTAGYPRATLDRLAVQAEKLYAENSPDSLVREALHEWDRRENAIPEWLSSIYGDVIKKARAEPGNTGRPKHKMRVLAELAEAERAKEQTALETSQPKAIS